MFIIRVTPVLALLTYARADDSGFANGNLVFSENDIEGKRFGWEVNVPAGTAFFRLKPPTYSSDRRTTGESVSFRVQSSGGGQAQSTPVVVQPGSACIIP